MYLGLDVGGTNTKCGILDEGNNLIYQHTIPTNAAKGRPHVLKSIAGIINRALKYHPDVRAIGIGIGGAVDRDGIVRIAPNLPGWNNVDIAKYLSKSIPLPVFVENDANIAALAEMSLGCCMYESDFLFVSLGSGVSSAIVYDRHILKGVNGGAGELGHIIIDMNATVTNKEQQYKTGILEEYVGKNKIAEQAKEVVEQYPNSVLHTYEKLDPYFISAAVSKGDKAGLKIFKNAGRILGLGLASAMNLLDIPLVILGGGMAQSHQILFQTALNTIKERAMPTIAANAELRFSHFAKETGVIGAALLAKLHLENEETDESE